jgi:hypothetical protein
MKGEMCFRSSIVKEYLNVPFNSRNVCSGQMSQCSADVVVKSGQKSREHRASNFQTFRSLLVLLITNTNEILCDTKNEMIL